MMTTMTMTLMSTTMNPLFNEQTGRTGEDVSADTIMAVVSEMLIGTPGVARPVGKQSKGVRAVIKETAIDVDIYFIAEFGRPIPEIAHRIQREVKTYINTEYPDYRLSSVNLRVEGIRFNQDSVLYRNEAIASLDSDLALPGGTDG